jgi:site-specific recombinase XerD
MASVSSLLFRSTRVNSITKKQLKLPQTATISLTNEGFFADLLLGMKPKKKNYPRGSGIAVEYREGRISPFLVKWKLPDGKRAAKTFMTEGEALAYANERSRAFLNNGYAGLSFTPKEIQDWRAFRTIVGEEANLSDISRLWLEHNKYGNAELGTMIAQYLVHYEKSKPDAVEGLRHLRPVLVWVENFFGSKTQCASISYQDAQRLFDNFPARVAKTHTKQNYHKKVKGFFEYLAEREIIPKNKFSIVRMPTFAKAELAAGEILTVEQTKNLLWKTAEATEVDDYQEIVGRLAVEAFTGMRSVTAGRLDNQAIDLKRKILDVNENWDKKGRFYRLNEASTEKNLWSWLTFSCPHKWKARGEYEWKDLKRQAFTRMGFVENNPPHNCLRHTFATMHVSLHGDVGKTATSINHYGSLSTLKSNYLEKAVETTVAQTYFAIEPPVPLKDAAANAAELALNAS